MKEHDLATRHEAESLAALLRAEAEQRGLGVLAVQARGRDGVLAWRVAFLWPSLGSLRSPLFRREATARGWLTKWDNGHA